MTAIKELFSSCRHKGNIIANQEQNFKSCSIIAIMEFIVPSDFPMEVRILNGILKIGKGASGWTQMTLTTLKLQVTLGLVY